MAIRNRRLSACSPSANARLKALEQCPCFVGVVIAHVTKQRHLFPIFSAPVIRARHSRLAGAVIPKFSKILGSCFEEAAQIPSDTRKNKAFASFPSWWSHSRSDRSPTKSGKRSTFVSRSNDKLGDYVLSKINISSLQGTATMYIYSKRQRFTGFFACVFLSLFSHSMLLTHSVLAQDVAASGLANAKAEMSKLLKLPSENAAREKSKAYIPTLQECAQVFEAEIAESVFNYIQQSAEAGEFVIGAPPNYSKLKLTAVTTDEIRTWSGAAAQEMAGGWKRIRESVLPGHTMYIVRFVEPGKDSGIRYDGLIRLKDKWVFFPKAWRHTNPVKAIADPPMNDSVAEPKKDNSIAGMSPKQAAFELGWRMAVAATLNANGGEDEIVNKEFRKAKLLSMATIAMELKALPALENDGNMARAFAYILNSPGDEIESKLKEKHGAGATAAFRAANRAVILLSMYSADKTDTLSASATASIKSDLKTCGVPKEVTAKLLGLLDQTAPRSEVVQEIFAYHTNVFNSLGPFKAPK